MRPPVAATLPLLVCTCFSAVSSAQDPTGGRGPIGPLAPPELAPDHNAQISEYVREVFEDRDGNLWFGTNGEGVGRYDGEALTFLGVAQGFGGIAVRGIVQDDAGAVWFATDGGVSRYEDGRFTNYTVADGLSDDEVWSIMLDGAGTIWVGTQAGVCRFDGEAFVPFAVPRAEVEEPESRFNPSVVWSMLEDREGYIWFATDGEGARRYDGESFTTYTTENGLAGNNVRCLYEDRRGRIWLGTDGAGVSCYDGEAFRHFTTDDGLSSDRVFGVMEDREGHLWFSTLGAGACRYDGETFTAFHEDRGLTRTHVQSMLEAEDGTLWFGCSGGLFRLDGESFVNVTRSDFWSEPAPAEDADPMASFARMVAGEWRVSFQSGTSQFDTWSWGPGERSIRVLTDGLGAAGEPWRALEVFYWHPGRQQVCFLGLSPYARGVTEGTIRFDGQSADAVLDLHQTGGRRSLVRRWTFDGPDEYLAKLSEKTGAPELVTLGEWRYLRSETRTPTASGSEPGAPQPSEHLKALEALVGHTWAAVGDGRTGGALPIQSTVEWVPYADYVHARSFAPSEDGGSELLLDAYVYHHTGTGALRCLALSAEGGVHEGEVSVLGSGALQLDLTSYEDDQVVPHVMRLDFEADGTLRDRVWAGGGTERPPVRDVRHDKLEPTED